MALTRDKLEEEKKKLGLKKKSLFGKDFFIGAIIILVLSIIFYLAYANYFIYIGKSILK